jgi:hypothetical protein
MKFSETVSNYPTPFPYTLLHDTDDLESSSILCAR